MSQDAVEQFLGRLITDDRFRRLAMETLEGALQEAGYQLSNREIQAIRLEDLVRLEIVAARLDSTLKRYRHEAPSIWQKSEASLQD